MGLVGLLALSPNGVGLVEILVGWLGYNHPQRAAQLPVGLVGLLALRPNGVGLLEILAGSLGYNHPQRGAQPAACPWA